MAPNPLLRIRPHAKKTFGEAFGAATGVSAPSYKRRRNLALRPLALGLPSAGDHDSTYRFFLTRRRGERGGRKIGFSPRAPRLRVNRGFACSKDVRRDVRRRDRGQRPTATKDPDTKQRRRV
jgi:hypothetical protein